MSRAIENISKPKVRFFQLPVNEEQEKMEPIESCTNKTTSRPRGPRIRSIVSLKKPVRLVDLTKSTNTHNNDTHSDNCTAENLPCNTVVCEKVETASPPDYNVSNCETSMILRNISDNQIAQEVSIVSETNKIVEWQTAKCSKHVGKENVDTASRKIASDRNAIKTKTKNCYKTDGQEKLKHNHNNETKKRVNFEELKITRSLSAPNITKRQENQATKAKSTNVNLKVSGVMPCHKHGLAARNRSLPVKKTVLTNVLGSNIETVVESGTSRCHQNDTKLNDMFESCATSLETITDRLAHPEHNSIMCTMDKLKELKQQKLVTDIDHLPFAQKNFVNGKVSTALDFPLDKAIYKDLVDLSVDENQLPTTIVRSKDPEPRQRDISPKLSDFFVPEDVNEVFMAAQITTRVPRENENWNAFKVSDKIHKWKYKLNNTN